MVDDLQNISESHFDKWIQKRYKYAEIIIHDKSRLNRLFEKSKNWFNRFHGSLNRETVDSLSTIFRMVQSWLSGKYTEFSGSALFTIVLALLYFVSPVDLIPDLLPGIGFLDDIFMIGLCVNRIASELNKFRMFERIEASRLQLGAIGSSTIQNVIIIPGWLTENSTCSQEKEAFQKVYPESKIAVTHWKSNSFWDDACRQTDQEASDLLLDQLEHLSGKTVLVGHSLGGRIIVRAFAKLFQCKREICPDIDHLILMGAAVDRNDPELALFSNCTDIPVYNFYRKTDRILGYIYQIREKKEPLGLLGSTGNIKNFHDIKIAGTEEYLLEVTRNFSLLVSSFGTKTNFIKLFSSGELVNEVTAMHHSFVEYAEFYRRCQLDINTGSINSEITLNPDSL